MRQEKIMMKILKITLASAMLFAGPTLVFAANGDRGPGDTPNGTDAGIGDKGRSSEQDKLLLDDMSTGSISNCETQTFDEYGNCVVDPNLQEVR
jgi:hypothetical protein